MSIAYRLVGLILACLGVCLGGGYIGHLRAELHSAQEATRTAQEALKKAQATLVYRERLRASTARQTASAQASLQGATASAPAWASTSTPTEVQHALCATLDCHAGPDGLRDGTPNSSP